MSAYQNAYDKGVKDQKEFTSRRGEEAAVVQEAQDILGTESPEAQADFWLGYYHGRYAARTGEAPPGQQGRARKN